jgi:hypothetical protein
MISVEIASEMTLTCSHKGHSSLEGSGLRSLLGVDQYTKHASVKTQSASRLEQRQLWSKHPMARRSIFRTNGGDEPITVIKIVALSMIYRPLCELPQCLHTTDAS